MHIQGKGDTPLACHRRRQTTRPVGTRTFIVTKVKGITGLHTLLNYTRGAERSALVLGFPKGSLLCQPLSPLSNIMCSKRGIGRGQEPVSKHYTILLSLSGGGGRPKAVPKGSLTSTARGVWKRQAAPNALPLRSVRLLWALHYEQKLHVFYPPFLQNPALPELPENVHFSKLRLPGWGGGLPCFLPRQPRHPLPCGTAQHNLCFVYSHSLISLSQHTHRNSASRKAKLCKLTHFTHCHNLEYFA